MNQSRNEVWLNLDQIIDDQLNLQVKMSYDRHHQFMLKHKLGECKSVLDVGTGNGLFVRTLAHDHPEIQFTGIDLRQHLVDRCNSVPMPNVRAERVDMQDPLSVFDFSQFDAVVMRYFLLHVPNAKEILQGLKSKMKQGTRFYIIDVDLSVFECTPENATFEKLKRLIGQFCEKNSIDTHAGQKLMPIFQELGFSDIIGVSDPFSTRTSSLDDMVRFMRQEALCYSQLTGRSENDVETAEILDFIEKQVGSGKFNVDYGMILWHATI